MTLSPQHSGDCRCLCGSLLARVVSGGVELKCRRCKRTLLVPFDPVGDARPQRQRRWVAVQESP